MMWFTRLKKANLTVKIILAMVMGIIAGWLLNFLNPPWFIEEYLISGVLEISGTLFITLLKMLVVPTVFVSIVCGTCSIRDATSFGRVISKTLLLYLTTTLLAISLGVVFAHVIHLGAGHSIESTATYIPPSPPSLKTILINLIPSNPIAAMSEGNMLQIIVFALLIGLPISAAKESGQRLANLFNDLNEVIIQLIHMVMQLAPYGVFCLITFQFARLGVDLIAPLLGYLLTTSALLLFYFFVVNSLLLRYVARLNPLVFFRKIYAAAIFAFSTCSSNASIPIMLDTVTNKLGVKNSIAAFSIPLGATVNMNGTALMQGITTVFLANLYNIDVGLSGYLTIIAMSTLAAIGTAGVPGVGTIMLTMVLGQIGIPIEGIAIIIGVERLLDMVRTAVNVTGDAVVSCIVAKSEKALDEELYYQLLDTEELETNPN